MRVLVALFLVGIWLDGVGTGIDTRILPRAFAFFLQVSALFPLAAHATIDYRAEGYDCKTHQFSELDTRPYFPIDTEDKENRFNRVMRFERHNGKTMHVLDDYLVDGHNRSAHADGIPESDRIGGVRLMSLRIPIPNVGDKLERWSRKPLSFYPEKERHEFYRTPSSKIEARCVRVQ